MADTKKSTLIFSRMRLENWRNFKKADVELQSRTFLVGPNAAGKSNFLDAFKFLRDVATEGGGFAKAVRDRGGLSSIRNLAARRQPDVGINVVISDGERSQWEYGISFKQDNQRRPLISREFLRCGSDNLFERPNREDDRDPELLTQTHIEQVVQNKNFRPLVDFFRSIRYLHVVPQIIRSPDRYLGNPNDPFGWDILERIANTPQKTQAAWLKKIESRLRIAVPQLQDLKLERDARGVPHLKSKYQHWRPQGAWQGEDVFSDGTLRLIGLLWAMLERSGPLLLEEPELSLNPHVVRHIPSMLHEMQKRSGRQVFVSTHSPELLEDRGIGLDEVLLLEPKAEGTSIVPVSSIKEARILLREGLTMSEIVLPSTRPPNAEQMSLAL